MKPSSLRASRARGWLSIVLLLLAACLIFIPYLDRSVLHDEAVSLMSYAQSPLVALFNYSQPNNHLLHSFFMWLSTSLIGDSLVGMRLPAFAAALLTLVMTWRLGRLAHGWQAGVLAGALLLASPMFMHYMVNARGYTLSAFLGLVVFELVAFEDLRRPAPPGLAVFLACMLLIMTLPTMLLLTGAAFLWSLWRGARTRSLAAPVAVGSLTGLTFYASGFVSGTITDGAVRYGAADLGALLSTWLAGLTSLPAAVLLAIGAAAGLWWLYRRQRRVLACAGLIFAVTIGVTLAQWLLMQQVPFARNYFYLFPLVTWAAGCGIAQLVRSSGRVTAALVVLVLVIAGVTAQPMHRPTRADALAAALERHARPTDRVIVGCCLDYQVYYLLLPAPYLLPDPPPERVVFVPTRRQSLAELRSLVVEQDAITLRGCAPAQWDDFTVTMCQAELQGDG